MYGDILFVLLLQIARLEGVSILRHLRLIALVLWLITVDASWALGVSYTLYVSEFPSVLFLFAFEYTILMVSAVTTFNKYILYRLDARWEGRWTNKAFYLFIIEFFSDLLQFVLYLAFFGIISVFYGLPLHLIRELYIAYQTLKDRIVKYYHYQKITQNMNDRFPLVTPEELALVDNTCIVCREDMIVQVRKYCFSKLLLQLDYLVGTCFIFGVCEDG